MAKVRPCGAQLPAKSAKWGIPAERQLEGFVLFTAVGGGFGVFVCGVSNYLLPGMNFNYGRWGFIGGAWGSGVALIWILVNLVFY
jgi:hypothetical protein